jgi:hypothetical protein
MFAVGDVVQSLSSGATYEVLEIGSLRLKLRCLTLGRNNGEVPVGAIARPLKTAVTLVAPVSVSVSSGAGAVDLPPVIAERQAHEQVKEAVRQARRELREFLNGG